MGSTLPADPGAACSARVILAELWCISTCARLIWGFIFAFANKPTLAKPVLENSWPLVAALPNGCYSETVASRAEHVKFSWDVSLSR